MEGLVRFLDHWQTLVGSTVGPFLAVILSAIGYLIVRAIEARKEYKEMLRRIEISTTRSLEGIYRVRWTLKNFVSRVNGLAKDIKTITDGNYFSLDSVNFPTTRKIYRDIEVPNFKVKSYYLHNYLLWIDAGIEETNDIVANIKNDFGELMRRNELIVALEKDNKKPNPARQRNAYVDNLESFAKMIEKYIESFPHSIEIMVQAKVYNEHLRGRFGFGFRWKHESVSCRYFRNKIDLKKFSKNLDSLESIDKAIQKEVDKEIAEATKRFESLQKYS